MLKYFLFSLTVVYTLTAEQHFSDYFSNSELNNKIESLTDYCIFFKSDLSDFYTQWQNSIELGRDKKHSLALRENAADNHTWAKRMKIIENKFFH